MYIYIYIYICYSYISIYLYIDLYIFIYLYIYISIFILDDSLLKNHTWPPPIKVSRYATDLILYFFTSMWIFFPAYTRMMLIKTYIWDQYLYVCGCKYKRLVYICILNVYASLYKRSVCGGNGKSVVVGQCISMRVYIYWRR